MAQIKMDVSEYEAMKKVESLLEKSLEKERKLQVKLEKVTKEKVDAMKAAAMKVVKVHKTQVTTNALELRSSDKVWDGLINLLCGNVESQSRGGGHINIENLEVNMRMMLRRAGEQRMSQFGYGIVDMEKLFFNKVQSISQEDIETTMHGLDEVKAEIREEYKSSQDAATKRKLKEALVMAEINIGLIDQNKGLNKDLRKKTAAFDNSVEATANHLKEISMLGERLKMRKRESVKIGAIKKLLKDGYGRWNRGELLKSVLKILADDN